MIYLKTGVGIELRENDILLAAVQSNFSKGSFTRFERITDYLSLNRADLCGAIDRFFRENSLSRDSVALGVSRKDCVIRYLDLPPEVKNNIGEVVHYQVQTFEPTEEDGFYYDYTLIDGAAGQKRLTLLLVMVRKSFLDEQLAMLREIGIKPLIVACGSIGLSNLYLASQKDAGDKIFFLADAGKSELELFALRNGQLVYSREAAKNDEQGWGDLLLGEISEAAARLRLGQDSVLEKIVLSGESSRDVYEEIKERIPDCELLNKSFPLTSSEINSLLIQEASTVCGLAFTAVASNPDVRLNLLPASLKRRQGPLGIIAAAALGVIVLLILAGLWLIEPVQNKRRLDLLEAETKKLEAPVQQVRELEARGEILDAQRDILTRNLTDDDRNLDILKYLTETFPSDSYLTVYQNINGAITLACESGSSSELIARLERSPILQDVKLNGAITRNTANGRESFQILAKLNTEAEKPK